MHVWNNSPPTLLLLTRFITGKTIHIKQEENPSYPRWEEKSAGSLALQALFRV
jgi:hypothetical protein